MGEERGETGRKREIGERETREKEIDGGRERQGER